LSGKSNAKVCFLPVGMPFSRHPATDGGLILKILATAVVPPSRSITSESVMGITPDFGNMLGSPNINVKACLTNSLLGLPNMKTWHDRLNLALNESGLSKSAFAKLAKVSRPTVTDWTNKEIKELKADSADRVCRTLNIRPEWLLRGVEPMRPQTTSYSQSHVVEKGAPLLVEDVVQALYSHESEYVAIPFQSTALRATVDSAEGCEIHFTEDETLKPLYYRRDWLKKHNYRVDGLQAREVSGSSMEPALYDGDTVLINLDAIKPKNGAVFEVIVDGQPCIKRLRKRGSEWWVTSDNPAYSVTDLPLENEQQVIGQVIERRSSHI